MQNLKQMRLRRARRSRAKIAELGIFRLSVHRTNAHIYAQLIDDSGGKVLASASTLEPEIRKDLTCGGNVVAASIIGKRIAEKAIKCGIEAVAFDRSGYKYHGRVKALAEAARDNGLKF
ncbi:LSU ribosomal protein L18P [Nitrosomonas cryotolerans]|uniref:Large ribosomal subunit protein uL18 n=1 Tax=Nitrosomonas cryotolerans ATCC 49181 TaxID=1131553 RepID=A0A1N6HJY0_9PROT|nr:50S ribosomal protein L18 [Nitrosomonas cryotolerans]SFP64795.1 LSU ribosomal protein L18P [Nitrosomonas cryotolerans]SIO20148.1 LSU ribosomal protein L18P [Nitrosomonas cryotolerans ATCC 49181]